MENREAFTGISVETEESIEDGRKHRRSQLETIQPERKR